MIIARVKGSVTSTIKASSFTGRKLLVVQPLDLNNEAQGDSILAIDVVDAGAGDKVLVMKEGSSARLVLDDEDIPVQAIIMGVIDEVHMEL